MKKVAKILEKVAKRVAKTKKAKISSTQLILKSQNIHWFVSLSL
jgi:hypothetical protein